MDDCEISTGLNGFVNLYGSLIVLSSIRCILIFLRKKIVFLRLYKFGLAFINSKVLKAFTTNSISLSARPLKNQLSIWF